MWLVKGFSLVEVLVASLMMMLGVTGYVTLQSEYVMADSQLSLRNIALHLAQEKLDELTNVSQLSRIAYDDIGSNIGGRTASGKMDVILDNNQQNQRSFDISWVISSWYFIDTDNNAVADLWVPTGHFLLTPALSKNVALKEVSVTIDWQDFQGNNQSLSINGRLAPVLQSRSAIAQTEMVSVNQSPQVGFTANRLPDSVEQVLDTDEMVQSASPLVLQTGVNNEISLSIEKYKNLFGQKILSGQSDFTTLACRCELVGLGMGSTPTIHVIQNDTLSAKAGQLVQKMTGLATPLGQSSLCQQCCHNHHDSAQTISDEQFYRSENGHAHQHYKLQLNGSYSPATLPGEVYDEVCRFKRSSGDFVLYPDWQLVDIIVLSPDYLLNVSNKTAYLAYNEGLLKAIINSSSLPLKPAGRDLAFSPGTFQFSARGLYLDRLTSADKTLIQAKIAKRDPDWLRLVPFYDVNLTLLADWHSSLPSVASMANDPIVTLVNPLSQYYGSFSRGLVTTNIVGSSTISASAFSYNATMAGMPAVSPFEALSMQQDTSVSVK
jgi:hypothetical protein